MYRKYPESEPSLTSGFPSAILSMLHFLFFPKFLERHLNGHSLPTSSSPFSCIYRGEAQSGPLNTSHTVQIVGASRGPRHSQSSLTARRLAHSGTSSFMQSSLSWPFAGLCTHLHLSGSFTGVSVCACLKGRPSEFDLINYRSF